MKKLIISLVGLILSPFAFAGGPPPPTVVVDHVQIPWALAFAPDGRIFFTERPGRLRVINVDGTLQEAPVLSMPEWVPDFRAVGEGGLMGLEIDPNFAFNGYLYVHYTHGSVSAPSVAVARLIEYAPGAAVFDTNLLDGVPGGQIHLGGRIKIGPPGDPDPKLFVTIGDSRCTLAQDITSYAGKILRMNLDGSVPKDNPFGNLVYSYGHRNPQGLAWDSSGQLYETEHGPTGDCGWERSWYDEVNIIFPGGNYGWPLCRGACGQPEWIDPLWFSEPPNSTPPTGAAFYNGSMFFGMMGTYSSRPDDYIHARQVHKITFDQPGGTVIVDEANLYQNQFGRIREVIVGPDGYLYFTTSDRDGRAGPALQPDDDKILRVLF